MLSSVTEHLSLALSHVSKPIEKEIESVVVDFVVRLRSELKISLEFEEARAPVPYIVGNINVFTVCSSIRCLSVLS